ncbi:MAG: chemotaxis protein CheX [Candidatus Cloacimonetes bacterium]|nr:chemotaxis protein CheX [Candidatus Cloacimonadota bacterium]
MFEHDKLAEVVLESCEVTFEEMLFYEVLMAENQSYSAIEDAIVYTIEVETPVHYRLCLIMPKDMVSEMADMLYAGAMEITDDILIDFVAELLNTFTGRIVSGLFPDEQDIFLSIPEHHEAMPFDLEKSHLVVLEVDDSKLYVMATEEL